MADTRVAVLIELAVGYRQAVIKGLWNFLETQPDWRIQGAESLAGELNALRRWKPQGVIVGIHDLGLARALARLHVPVVDVFNWFSLPNFTQVSVDDQAVGCMAAEYFLSHGLKTFAVIGDISIRFASQRYAGFSKTLASSGFTCSHIEVGRLQTAWTSEFSTGPDMAVRRELMDLPKPSGVFSINDDWAAKVIELCHRDGLRVPDDLAVLGVDNEELLCNMARPPLSSIETGAERVGWQAGNALAQLLDGRELPNPLLLAPIRVVERQSTDVFAIEDQEVLAAVRFIQANAHRGVNVRDVLRTVPTRRRTLEHQFRGILGRSILDEIQRSRVTRAKTLLATTDLKLSVVAHRSGFGNARHLSRVFRQVAGETPAGFRRHQAME